MANTDKTIDLTRIGGFTKRPKILISEEHLSKTMNNIPSFLNVVPINIGSDIINACYFKDSISGPGDFHFDLGMLTIPKEFRYVKYDIIVNQSGDFEIDNLKETEKDSTYNLFTPMLLNLNDQKDDDKFFHHCANFKGNGVLESFRREGCIPDYTISMRMPQSGQVLLSEEVKRDVPFVIFYCESKKDLRTKITLGNGDEIPANPDEKIFEYYLILLQVSEKNFVYYAISKDDVSKNNNYDDWEKILNIWINTKYKNNVLGIGIQDRLCYNDELMVFITSNAVIVS